MIHNYPAYFARFYDIIYHHLRDGDDHAFFMNKIQGSGGKILEAGVGTGRFFMDALEQGTDIYGFDISASMLSVLNGKLEKDQQYRVSQQNIIDFHYDFQFDLIIAPFRVIMHIIDKEDQLQALNNIHKHLKPGGKFIFDTFVPNPDYLVEGFNNVTDFEGEYAPGYLLRRIVSTKPDLINQLINVTFRIEWEEDGDVKVENWTFPLRFFFRYELEHLIDRSAFNYYEILGDYQENELKKDSKEFIAVCRKGQE